MSNFLRRTLLSLAVTIVSTGTGVGLLTAPAHAAFTSSVGGYISRAEVMERAQHWVDHQPGSYDQNATAPDPTHSRNYRRDCSGYVDMVWHLASDPNTDLLPGAGYTKGISRSELLPGDILNWANPNGDGHVIIFKRWANRKHTRNDDNRCKASDSPKRPFPQVNATMTIGEKPGSVALQNRRLGVRLPSDPEHRFHPLWTHCVPT